MRKENVVTRKLAMARAKASCLVTTAMLSMPMTASANDWTSGKKDAGNLVKQIAEVVIGLFPLIGAFFIIAGVFKLIMAYRNDNPEGQTGAAKDIVIGAVFVGIRVFAWNAIQGALFG